MAHYSSTAEELILEFGIVESSLATGQLVRGFMCELVTVNTVEKPVQTVKSRDEGPNG